MSRTRMPDMGLAISILWIWLGFVGAIVLVYLLFRWWRKHHPARRPEPKPRYAETLQRRLRDRRTDRKSRKAPPEGQRRP